MQVRRNNTQDVVVTPEVIPERRHNTLDDVLTPEEILKLYPDKFTKRQITWFLRNRHHNGLQKADAVSLVGRKFYIHKPKFLAWLLSQKR